MSPYRFTYGIQINKTTSSAFTTTPIVINENSIRNMRYGVYLNNARNARIMDNTIQMQSNNNTLYGIYLTSSRNNWIQCNDISEPIFISIIPFLSVYRSAIELRSSTSNIISTNSTLNSPVGLSIRGNCSMPNRLAGNVFNNHYYHIVLNNAGRIGPQQNIGSTIPLPTTPDNQFLPTTLLPTSRYKIVAANSTSGALSPFDYNITFTNGRILMSEVTNLYSSTSIIPTSIPSGFSMSYTPATCTSPLPFPRLANPDEIDDNEEIAYSEYGSSSILDELLYEDKKNLYLQLKEGSVFSSDSLFEYMLEYETTKDYDILNAKELLDNGNKQSANDMVNSIETSIDPALLMIELIKYQSDTLVLDTTNVYWNRIREIASICPWLGGEAVYIAQGIIMSNSDINEWEDMDICNTSTEPSGSRLANTNSTEIFNQRILEAKNSFSKNKIYIYPNPTNDYLFINTNKNNIKKYLIKDITGRLIIENDYSANKINVSYLTNGIYIIELVDINNTSVKFKFIKDE